MMIMTMYVCVDHCGVSVLQGLVLGGGLHRGELSYYEQPFFGIYFFFRCWAQEAQNFLRNSVLASSLFLSPSLSPSDRTGNRIWQDRTGQDRRFKQHSWERKADTQIYSHRHRHTRTHGFPRSYHYHDSKESEQVPSIKKKLG